MKIKHIAAGAAAIGLIVCTFLAYSKPDMLIHYLTMLPICT
jgi:hypothetical protein